MSTETPIIFDAESIRNLLANRKTVFRQIASNANPNAKGYLPLEQPLGEPGEFAPILTPEPGTAMLTITDEEVIMAPYQVGQQLWVQEEWRVLNRYNDHHLEDIPKSMVAFEADQHEYGHGANGAPTNRGGRAGKLRAAADMPRWASRLTLEVVGVHLERLQGLSDAEAILEGIEVDEAGHAVWPGDEIAWSGARNRFMVLWDEAHNGTPGSAWDENPYVWIITFKQAEAPA